MTATLTVVRGGVWLGASYVLGKPIPVSEPYPHICGHTVTGAMTGEQFQVWRNSCAACAQEAFEKAQARRGAA